MKIFRRMFAILAILLIFSPVGVVAAAPTHAMFADAKSDVCAGIDATSGSSGCVAKGPDINSVIVFAIRTLSMVAGILAVIMIILAGFKYITSQGDASKISSAKTSLIYAIVGIVVVVMSQILVFFVLKTALNIKAK